MSQSSWQQHIDHVTAKGVLPKRLYVIFTEPTAGIEALHAQLGAHLAYQKDLEARGITFGAGPFADDAESEWSGEGTEGPVTQPRIVAIGSAYAVRPKIATGITNLGTSKP